MEAAVRLARIRARVLPPHLWFTWRDRSFGSSANNHLLGELAGLILALVRWPSLTRWARPDRYHPERLGGTSADPVRPRWRQPRASPQLPFLWLGILLAGPAGVACGGTQHVSAAVDDRLRSAAGYFSRSRRRKRHGITGIRTAPTSPLFSRLEPKRRRNGAVG